MVGKKARPWTLGVGLAALLALAFVAVVTVLLLREPRKPPEFAGVFDAQPLPDPGVEQRHDATEPESRDEGAPSLAAIPAAAQPIPSVPPIASANEANRRIVSILPSMPSGGGSEADAKSMRALEEAIQVRENQLEIKPAAAQTTYSSGATYLVFLQALKALLPPGTLSGPLAEALMVKGQPDGVGVWGRWNANGPGIACLFDELQLGPNFTSFEDAQAGDFMKAFFGRCGWPARTLLIDDLSWPRAAERHGDGPRLVEHKAIWIRGSSHPTHTDQLCNILQT